MHICLHGLVYGLVYTLMYLRFGSKASHEQVMRPPVKDIAGHTAPGPGQGAGTWPLDYAPDMLTKIKRCWQTQKMLTKRNIYAQKQKTNTSLINTGNLLFCRYRSSLPRYKFVLPKKNRFSEKSWKSFKKEFQSWFVRLLQNDRTTRESSALC